MRNLKVEDWIQEIDNGLEYRRLYGIEDEWSTLEALFYSVHESSLLAGPNLIAASGDSLLSQITVPVPSVVVKAKRPNLATAARVLESVDNTLLKEIKVGREVENASLHAFLWGRGILKVGYDSEFGYSPEFILGEDLGLSMTQYDIKGRRIEFGSVRPGMPWIAACLPHDIVVPYGTKNMDDAPWIAHRVVRHVEDIKSDVKYSKKRDLMPMMSMDDFVKSYRSVVKPYRVGSYDTYFSGTGKSDYCELWEIHDRRTRKIIVIATGHKSFLRNEEDLMQLNDLPFISFSFVPAARTFWTTPDSTYLKPFQAELSDIFHQASKQRRLSILKFLYGKGVIEKAELNKILSPDVGVGAGVNAGHDLKEAILPLTMPNNNPMLYNDAEYVRRSARETIGFSRNQMGEYEQRGRRTATEASIVKQSADTRMSRRQKVIKGVYEDVISKVNAIIFEFWKSARWTEVAGESGAQWIEYVGSQLRGDYAYDISFSPAGMDSKEQRKQIAMQLYSIFSQDPNIDPAKLKTYLVNAFNDREFSDLFGGVENASLQVQMPQVQQGAGGTAPNKEQGQASPMSGM